MAIATRCILMICLIAPTWAHAGSTEAEKEIACKDDAMRLCSEFVPDRDKITLCMQRRIPQLTPACRAIFDEDKPKSK
ncbi:MULTISPECIES: hypothetical protein [Rhodopseudomonas]|uniref:hypothetical protein n=1 Tax=Rhodopseudomonas TaxID=1073 RepID=UPI0009B94F67|nr:MULTISPECIES: hypothetical protein [Rhodopseudomonas]MDF3809922.1 hypothetical protein [Rhodopseudomonas sp. BAL398]WOK20518.1 hypothetical protein RBJ75_13780 [Rhodopseudomonas sp. BAL398]